MRGSQLESGKAGGSPEEHQPLVPQTLVGSQEGVMHVRTETTLFERQVVGSKRSCGCSTSSLVKVYLILLSRDAIPKFLASHQLPQRLDSTLVK